MVREGLTAARDFQHGMKQHVAPSGSVGGSCVLNLSVADAVFARNENHAGGCDPGQITGVMSGAGDNIAVAVAESSSGGAHGGNACIIEGHRLISRDLDNIDAKVRGLGDVFAGAAKFRVHSVENPPVGMANIGREKRGSGDRVSRVRFGGDHTNRGDGLWSIVAGDSVGLGDHPHRPLQCIAPYRHRRRAGVGFLSLDRDFVGALPLSSGDYSNNRVFRLLHRSLFDMGL